MREAVWLAGLALGVCLALALLTHHPDDPGWSRAGGSGLVHNAAGPGGAWLADVLYYVFGRSALWLLLAAGIALTRTFGLLMRDRRADRVSVGVMAVGLLLLLVGGAALEAQLVTLSGAQLGPAQLEAFVQQRCAAALQAGLPACAGGALGQSLAGVVHGLLGATGATLLLLVLPMAGLSLLAGISWLELAEYTGAGVEWLALRLWRAVEDWRDRRLGARAARERDSTLADAEALTRERKPVKIIAVEEPPEVSERVDKEKQRPLFTDLPGDGLPPLALLDPANSVVEGPAVETLEFTSRLIEHKLREFGVDVTVLAAYPGPVITRYEIEPATGVKGSQIVNLVKDLARALSVSSIRVVETIPGKSCMGLEIPNARRQTVRLSEVLSASVYADNASPLTLALGKDIGGAPMVADLAKMPHLLVAGTTGSGKSVAINAMILSLLFKAAPAEVRLILVDPKMLELSVYDGIPHLLAPVVTDMKQAAHALAWCTVEMDRRYRLMSALGVRNLAGYNIKVRDASELGVPLTDPLFEVLNPGEAPPLLEPMPTIVVVIDELADLMMVVGKKIEELIARLAQKARAAGIHLILATQRPSVDVITGLIKANVPTRVAFQVSSKVDSRTILDQMGAETLLGMGDMLYLPPGTGVPVRAHGAFVSDEEVHRVVEFLRQQGEPDYVEGMLDGDAGGGEGDFAGGEGGGGDPESDPLYDEAVALVLRTRRASISAVQRQLRIGYNRAARLIEAMEQAGLVSPMESNGNRTVLVRAPE
ncbi:MAG: DNA translocase FtsK [Rhodocyclaceae bacterium]|nr:DNA translocase FtsK [Rhodocyclaceae bacterium]